MSAETEGAYQLQTAGSSGFNVRTVTLRTYVDGVLTDVQMQVMAIADADGRLLDFSDNTAVLREILDEQRALRRLLAKWLKDAGALVSPHS